jgi:hypothetical protein
MNEDDFRQLDRIARATQRAQERRREWRQREGGIRSHLSSVAVSIENFSKQQLVVSREGEPGLEFAAARVREDRVALGASLRIGQADNGLVTVSYLPGLVVEGRADLPRAGEVLGTHEPEDFTAAVLDGYVSEFLRRVASEHWSVVGTPEGAKQAWEVFSVPPASDHRYL